MFRLFLGNLGSGKTATAVYEMFKDTRGIPYYSNIRTKLKYCHELTPSMLVKKELLKIKTTKSTGLNEEVFKYSFNEEFWLSKMKEGKGMNIILDEFHTLLDARRFGSKQAKIINDFMALARRILSSSDKGMGTFTAISQLGRRIDVIFRDLCTEIRYHQSEYTKECQKCFARYRENSLIPPSEQIWQCRICKSFEIKKKDFIILIYLFETYNNFERWHEFGEKTYYNIVYIDDIERIFPLYNTLQWDNLMSNLFS